MTFDEQVALDQVIYDRIRDVGDWQRYFNHLHHRQKVYQGGEDGRVLCCADDRLDIGGACVCAMGSLLLSDRSDTQRICQEAGITAIASHQDCKALMPLWRRINGDIAPMTSDDFNAFVDWQTAQLAHSMGVAYAGQITHDRFRGPENQHAARTIYYIGSTQFNPRALPEGLPYGYAVSRCYRLFVNALADVDTAIAMAMGFEGLGDRITSEQPITVLTISGHEDSVPEEVLINEVTKLTSRYDGKVVIASLVI